MGEVAARLAEGSKRRYQIRGRQVEEGWWAYEVLKVPRDRPVRAAAPSLPNAQQMAEIARGLPRCAQRAGADRGGNSKVAWPSRELAHRAAELSKGRAYRCTLPSPAIGEHWHHTTTVKRRKRP